MTLRLPLFGRILVWLLLNLLILGVAFGVFLWTELGGESSLGRAAGDRSQAAAGALMAELRERPMVEWERAMARFEEAYPVRVMLLREDGSVFLGAKLKVPAELVLRLRALAQPGPGFDDRRSGPPPGQPPEDHFEPGPMGAPGSPPPRSRPRPRATRSPSGSRPARLPRSSCSARPGSRTSKRSTRRRA